MNEMQRWLTSGLGLYFLVWVPLEGNLTRVVIMALGTTAVSILHFIPWYTNRWTVSRIGYWAGTAVLGLFAGLGSGLLTLFFMALKTGLHAHGPEFTPAEISWVWRQLPWWTAAGFLAGSGLALLTTPSK